MQLNFPQFLFGGDYNPDQWLDEPEILDADIRMMKKAHINIVSLGIFAWARLEPDDGVYDFDWMQKIIDRLYENGIYTDLATPSGARPHWLADRYPEVLSVNAMRQRLLFGGRHNHCFTSPAYRKKVHDINQALAKQFDSHPGVVLWHISNEYGTECHCPLCQEAFRGWLKKRYVSIDELNKKWNTAFWSHTYRDFDQIESPSPLGEQSIHGLTLDWKRFVSDQNIDFCRSEIQALREAGAKKPVTTNMMYYFPLINYHEMAKVLDVVSWDNYPRWHKEPESQTAMDVGMMHDILRTLKKKPFLMMESCPSSTNWQSVSKLKKPGMLETEGLQAVAHGSDSVMYFQIRKGRGGAEKFHGSVIDHYGGEDDRVYRECCQIGEDLEKISGLCHAQVRSQAAVVYDWENRWALEEAQGPRNKGLFYKETVQKSYQAFRRQGLNVDVIDMTQPLDEYKVVAAPLLYLFRDGFEEKVRSFVKSGGTFILTYWSGVVDENDRCFLGGTPGGLMDVMGLRSTEIDALYDWEKNVILPVAEEDSFMMQKVKAEKADGNPGKVGGAGRLTGRSIEGTKGLTENIKEAEEKTEGNICKLWSWECRNLCQLVKTDTAKALCLYGEDFYAGTPALTVNRFGEGLAYYICADAEQDFYNDLYRKIAKDCGLRRPLKKEIPEGIEVTTRTTEEQEYLFLQNFNSCPVAIHPELEGWKKVFGDVGEEIPAFSTAIYERNFKSIHE